jgi:hypothetical protein
MARRTVTILTCDLCDDPHDDADVTTLRFGYSGRDYELDACPTHAEEVRAALSGWARRGRAAGSTVPVEPARRSRPTVRPDKAQIDAIRRWARDNGYQVTDRGRVPERVMDAFPGGARHASARLRTARCRSSEPEPAACRRQSSPLTGRTDHPRTRRAASPW